MGHTNDVHNLMVHDNVFAKMGRSAIEFNNGKNDADGNVYGVSPGPFGFGAGPYLRVKFPEPPEWDNLQSWREQRHWDEHGATAEIDAELDPDTLQLTFSAKGAGIKPLPDFKGIDTDFFGKPVSGDRGPGPFADLMTQTGVRKVDPR